MAREKDYVAGGDGWPSGRGDIRLRFRRVLLAARLEAVGFQRRDWHRRSGGRGDGNMFMSGLVFGVWCLLKLGLLT